MERHSDGWHPRGSLLWAHPVPVKHLPSMTPRGHPVGQGRCGGEDPRAQDAEGSPQRPARSRGHQPANWTVTLDLALNCWAVLSHKTKQDSVLSREQNAWRRVTPGLSVSQILFELRPLAYTSWQSPFPCVTECSGNFGRHTCQGWPWRSALLPSMGAVL